MNAPLVSVVMPVYNSQGFLVQAVSSIIEQTFRDWELVCVNDGSTDASPQILDWFGTQDRRIRVLHQTNQGIVPALNRGCAVAGAPLIARMDADDIALPRRLGQQIEYFRTHPDCVAVGGSILQIDEESDPLGLQSLPTSHDAICNNLLNRRTGLFHPTTVIRADAMRIVGGYRDQYQWIEDHDLWLRLAQVGKLANQPDVVLCYRQHAHSVCWQRSQLQRARMNDLLEEAYRLRGLSVPPELIAERPPRTSAGPGKWARVAARGGHPRVAFKHLRRLWRDEGWGSYTIRMTCETALRSLLGLIRRPFTTSDSIVPRFPHWEHQASQANLIAAIATIKSHRAA